MSHPHYDAETGAGNINTRSYSHSTGPAGVHWLAGYYDAPAADANLTQASTTVVMGSAASGARNGHAFMVAGGPGSVDAGTVSIVVSGTSITNAGVRTPADSETICTDVTTLSTNDYLETSKHWLGAVTYTLTPAGAAVYSVDFNYGLAKYEDFANTDYTITEFAAEFTGGSTDTGIDIELLHHRATGWVYSAAAFVPGDGAIVSMATDYSTDAKIITDEGYSYKRTGLARQVAGSGLEGVLVRLTTATNNSIAALDCHITRV
jgi:hypothetical protein